jgi:hypothetical protein
MQYLLLIYDDERAWGARSDDERRAMMQEYLAYSAALRDAGVYVDGNALTDTTEATTVAVREGDVLVSDGPYAETKEQLGGYYIIDCETAAQAREWAARIPSARLGSVEIRPIASVPAEAGA